VVPLDHFKAQTQQQLHQLSSQVKAQAPCRLTSPFASWDAGQDLFAELNRNADSVVDRDVRPLAEECDQLAGLQIFTGTDDGWGGFSSRYIDALRDEFGKASLWVWGVEDGSRGVSRVSLFSWKSLAQAILLDRSLRVRCASR
jgi:hypothetical protein